MTFHHVNCFNEVSVQRVIGWLVGLADILRGDEGEGVVSTDFYAFFFVR